jgi:hypothetical protein
MRPDELERKRMVESGGSVVANVRKTKGRRADEDLIRWAEESGHFVYIGDAVRHTHYRRSPWFNPAKARQTDHDRAVREYRGYILHKPDFACPTISAAGKSVGVLVLSQDLSRQHSDRALVFGVFRGLVAPGASSSRVEEGLCL